MNIFSDPQFVSQLMTNPKARELLKDPETANLLRVAQQKPNDPEYVFLLKKVSFAIFVCLQTSEESENHEIVRNCSWI